jgi:hypothetical protein
LICTECSEELKVCASMLEKLNRPDWNQFPPELWLKVFGYLDWDALNTVHLVSQKFHGLADKIGHCLRLDWISSPIRFKESNRIYKEIRGLEFQENSEVYFDFSIENFAGIKRFGLRNCRLSQSLFYMLLKMLPNLEHLYLDDLQSIDTDDSADFPDLVLPKLQDIHLCEIDEKFTGVINGMKCPAITRIKYFVRETENLMPFVDSNLTSVRKLTLFNRGESFFDFTSRLQNFNAENLESLNVVNLRIDPPTLARIFNGRLKLKGLILGNMTDGALNSIFNSCPDLEVLVLIVSFESPECLNGIQKLKKLKNLEVCGLGMNHDHQILRGLMVEVNPNLEELIPDLNLHGITVEFLTELSSFIPNLKTLKIHESCPKEIKDVIPMLFKRIEEVSPLEFSVQLIRDRV